MSRTVSLALLQMVVGPEKSANLSRAGEMIARAVENLRADAAFAAGTLAPVVVLPEFFNAPYDMKRLSEYAEETGGPTCRFLEEQARTHGIILAGGTIPEIDNLGLCYNTCFTYGPDGSLLGRHRKVHLFDIDMPGKICFRESDHISAGHEMTVIRHSGFCFGVMVCFDIRFPEWSRLAVQEGAELLIVPAAFNTTTGPLHWELVLRSRAVDNQVFLAACSPARSSGEGYQAWGHSLVCDPMGQVLIQADEGEQIICCQLELDQLKATRESLPILKGLRQDLYEIRSPNLKPGHNANQ